MCKSLIGWILAFQLTESYIRSLQALCCVCVAPMARLAKDRVQIVKAYNLA